MLITDKYKKATSNKGLITDKYKSTGKTGTVSKYVTKPAVKTNTDEGITAVAVREGYGAEAEAILNPKPRLSFLRRLGAGLGAFETGNAVATGLEKKSFFAGVKQYGKDFGKGVASAVTGRDYGQTEKKSYKDILEGAGVHNKIAKYGIGFVGDVLLDPSTYFGGALVKGAVKGTKAATNASLKGVGKVAPKVEQGIRLAGQGVKDALGKGFKFGYGTSKGLPERALEIEGKISKAKEGIVKSNIARLGTGTLSQGQQDELVEKLLAGKRAEFGARKLSEDIAQSADWFQPLKNRAERLVGTREKNLRLLEREISRINKQGLKVALKPSSKQVLPQLTSKVAIKTVPEQVLFGADDELLKRTPGYVKATDAGFAVPSNREVKTFVEALIKLPKTELASIRKALNVREGWKASLLDEIADLNNEYTRLADLQQDTFKLADATRAAGKTGATEVAQSADPLVQKTITSQTARSQKFAKSAGVDDPYTVYFPGIAKDKLKKFLEYNKPFRVGSESYRKEFKDLLKDEDLVRNPAEAFARREFDIAKDNIVRSQLHGIVKEFGQPSTAFKTADEATKAGYVAIKEKGNFGKVVGYLTNTDKKFLDNLSPEFTTIDAIAKYTGFDAVTSLFKRSVTGLFAPFHVRNYVSGMVQNFEVLGPKALSPSNLAFGQRMAYKMATGKSFGKETIDLGRKTYSLNKLMEPFAKRFETSSQYISDIAEATSGKLIPSTLSKLNPVGVNSPHFRAARAIGNYVETQQKATAYITALKQGKTVKQALELATRAGFDYRALTPLESKVFRRIIPFYSFTRKNLELQLRTLGENPQRINQIINLIESSGNMTPEEKLQLPDYAQEQFAVKTGTSLGLPEFAVGFGTPVEQVGQLLGKNPIRRIAAMMNPVFKLPLERAFNKDFFRDRPLTDVVEAGEYSRAPKIIQDFLQVTASEKKGKDGNMRTVYNANPYRLQLLRNLPTTRGATYVSAIFNSGSKASAILNSVTGIKARPIDLETVEYFRDRDRRRELEDLLIRAGVLKRFETTYKPKN